MKESEHMSWCPGFLQIFLQLILGYFLKLATVIFGLLFQKPPLVAGIFLCGCWRWRFWTYIYVLGCSEIILTTADETATGLLYTVGCLDACAVAVHSIQWGRKYTSLACKGLIFAVFHFQRFYVNLFNDEYLPGHYLRREYSKYFILKAEGHSNFI